MMMMMKSSFLRCRNTSPNKRKRPEEIHKIQVSRSASISLLAGALADLHPPELDPRPKSGSENGAL